MTDIDETYALSPYVSFSSEIEKLSATLSGNFEGVHGHFEIYE